MALTEIKWKFKTTVLLGLCLSFCVPALARVSTAPTSADQRLINPAAAAYRESYGYSIDGASQDDQEKVLNLKDASIEIATKIYSLNTNSVVRSGHYFWELSLSPQMGNKSTASSSQNSSGTDYNNTSSDLSLVPLQVVLATRLGTNLSFGLKLQYTHFNFADVIDLAANTQESSETIQENRNLSGYFLVMAPGVVYQLGASGILFSYVAEFLQFQNDQSVQGTVVRLSGSGVGIVETITTDTQSRDTMIARKDILGIGYNSKFGSGNSFRLEASYERMPPLTKVQGFSFGEMFRVIAELNFLYFRLGVEASQSSGYYIDPYNLIPYFFKIDHLSGDPVQEIGFFGGLKTSKGHGFGASFSQSTSTSKRKLSVGSSEQEVEKRSTTFGLSYAYFF